MQVLFRKVLNERIGFNGDISAVTVTMFMVVNTLCVQIVVTECDCTVAVASREFQSFLQALEYFNEQG